MAPGSRTTEVQEAEEFLAATEEIRRQTHLPNPVREVYLRALREAMRLGQRDLEKAAAIIQHARRNLRPGDVFTQNYRGPLSALPAD